MKKIKPGEEFALHNTVYTYSLLDDRVILKAIRNIETKATNKFTPPTLDEVKAFFKEKGYVESAAIKAYDYYTTMDWHDTNNKPVKNWKAKMISVWMREEFKIKEAAPEKQVHSKFFLNNED